MLFLGEQLNEFRLKDNRLGLSRSKYREMEYLDIRVIRHGSMRHI